MAGALKDFLPEHIKVEYTAEDGPKFPIKKTLKSGMPNDQHLVSCYPFKGVTAIQINNTPLAFGETTSSSGTGPSDTDPSNARGSDGDTSGEECNLEHGKQADPLYLPQPQKLGELNANMHISLTIAEVLTCKVTRA